MTQDTIAVIAEALSVVITLAVIAVVWMVTEWMR